MKRGKRSRANGDLPFVDPVFAESMSARRGGGSRENAKPDYKALQVCRQAQQALSLALAGECNDDLLRSLYVESVEPAPDASRLLVFVVVPSHLGVGVEEVLSRLADVHGLLRSAVARAISRKRAPELSFVPTREREMTP